jgi:hypothetical protein
MVTGELADLAVSAQWTYPGWLIDRVAGVLSAILPQAGPDTGSGAKISQREG